MRTSLTSSILHRSLRPALLLNHCLVMPSFLMLSKRFLRT